MERKIGEIFEYNGEWYQCVKGNTCDECSFNKSSWNCLFDGTPHCSDRSDEIEVIFKKLEKVGEPIKVNGKVIQTLKLHTSRCECEDCCFYRDKGIGVCCKDSPCRPYEIFVEIKQNQEDMEEKKNEELSNLENTGKNLKPFDLEAARSGKPVCTRDGRKARIICFDMKGDICPMVAAVEENGVEYLYRYDENGQNAYNKSKLDLMMIPEKKEGWVNVYKVKESPFGYITSYFDTEENAKEDKELPTEYVATVKINWSE